MTPWLKLAHGVLAVVLLALTQVFAQTGPPQSLTLPERGTLEGIPSVRVLSTADATTRQVLNVADAASNPLKVQIRDGQFFWASHGDQPLRLFSSGPYTYLQSEPGSYIRLSRINDRIYYVEHTDLREHGSVTWWGELRIVLTR